jgi:hypothetical protein
MNKIMIENYVFNLFKYMNILSKDEVLSIDDATNAYVELENAIESGDVLTVKKLLNDGKSNPDCQNLFTACGVGNTEIVKLLLESVSPGDYDDEDPLLESIYSKYPEIVTLLLNHEDTCVDNSFYSPEILEEAIKNSNYKTVTTLFKHPKMVGYVESTPGNWDNLIDKLS